MESPPPLPTKIMSEVQKNVPSWQCPYCGHHQHSGDKNTFHQGVDVNVGETEPNIASLIISARRCLNKDCNRLTLGVTMQRKVDTSKVSGARKTYHKHWRLIPESSAKPQPDYIPEPLREDYEEACLVRGKSPKASATLARRCLQGMIRHFCKITKGTLDQEIRELKKRVDEDRAPKGVEPEHIAAIDAVRKIGNIGAHMEKDINLIIEVDPGEAGALIELVEMLFGEWYIARKKREDRLAAVVKMAEEKEAARLAQPVEPLIIEASPDKAEGGA